MAFSIDPNYTGKRPPFFGRGPLTSGVAAGLLWACSSCAGLPEPVDSPGVSASSLGPHTLLAGAAARMITPVDDRGRLWQEPFTDQNGNGRYDAPDPLHPERPADPFDDLNRNGKWDGPFMAGFGHKGSYYTATEVHDPLWARALVLEYGEVKLGLVAIDAVGYLLPEVEAVRQEAAGAGFSYVLVASTHTHEGPDTLGLWGPNPFTDGKDPRLMDHIRRQILAALEEADRVKQPARLAAAEASLPDAFGHLVADRRDPVVIDPGLTVLRLAALNGKTIAVLVKASIHPETLGGKDGILSSDFPHFLREGVENGGFRVSGRPVHGTGGLGIFFNGAVGGLMTTLGVEVQSEDGTVLPQRSWEKTRRIGELLADASLSALAGAEPVAVDGLVIRTREVRLPLDNPRLQAMISHGVIQRPTYRNGRPVATPEVGNEIVTETGLITLRSSGKPLVQILAVPGELFPEMLLGGYLTDTRECWAVTDRKKKMDGVGKERVGAARPGVSPEPVLRDFITAPTSMLIGLANDELGYIVPSNDFVFPSYRPGPVFGVDRCGSKDHYEETLSASSKMAPALARALVHLLREEH